ncbi:hypothetical protein AUEXF2481DRAFT_701778 [Aureobasidium subglaciale EXF-2481]|uniref:F-box domain-containing protein n=1 Tax=Aureobasidium subglaciale (strain EXF-2481) TaxID=1043005 RepID=A0A074Y152_AURSE|nr:uncharacterized protein AUEXF2481DRAFT_701778 [Aureobasidium subglaciale EXF-2481]KEQ91533.1 hypothetical protein AUEXF2481DRAFT_701778 [Aureobasidium subglaciale EXF-2481]
MPDPLMTAMAQVDHTNTRPLPVLPAEIIARILDFVSNDKPTLVSVACANRVMFEQAIRYLWSDVGPDNKQVGRMLRARDGRLQVYAAQITKLSFEISSVSLLPPLNNIPLPLPQYLDITYDGVQDPRRPPTSLVGCHVLLNHLIVPTLKGLYLHRPMPSVGNFSTGNFLPRLADECVGLEELRIASAVTGATPSELVKLLDSCQRLDQLWLATADTDNLIDESSFKHVASHPCLTTATIHSDTSACFGMKIEAESLIMILPHVPGIQWLLTVLGPTSIFNALRYHDQLSHLIIEYPQEHHLSANDFAALAHLTSLRRLDIRGQDTEDLTDVHADIYCNSALINTVAALFNLEILNPNIKFASWDMELLVSMGISCRSLSTLIVCGAFDVLVLDGITAMVLFSELLSLELSCLYDFAGSPRVNDRVKKLVSIIKYHAPKLETFKSAGNEFSKLVQTTWGDLKEN